MKNLLFHLKAVKTGTHKAQVGAGAGNFLIVEAGTGAGAESNSFGSATLANLQKNVAAHCLATRF